MAENAPDQIDSMLTPIMGENWPVVKDWLKNRPFSTRTHPATMSALNQALYNTAALISSQYIHLRPNIDSWVYRVFKREKLDSIYYQIERTIVDPMILKPAPEGSTFELSTFQYMQRKGVLHRFRLGFRFSMDDLLTAQGAKRFEEFTIGLLYAETSLALALAIRCFFSFPLRILANDDQPGRPNYDAPEFMALWKQANDSAYALADPRGIYKMTQLADIRAASYNKDIFYDNIILPPGSQIYILHGTNHYGTFEKSGLVTTRDLGNKQIIFEGFTDRQVFEQPVWKLANLESYEGDPLGRECVWSLWSALFRNGNARKPALVDWESYLSVDLPDQSAGGGKYSTFGPRNGLFEAMNVFNMDDEMDDEMGRLDEVKIQRMLDYKPHKDFPGTHFTWKAPNGKFYPARFLGDVPFECRDISKDDAKHIADMMDYLGSTCMVDCEKVREAFRAISNIQEELSTGPVEGEIDANLATRLDELYGINEPANFGNLRGYGGINGLMYLYANMDRLLSFAGLGAATTRKIGELLQEHLPRVIDFVNRLIATYPDCPIFSPQFCPPYCLTTDEYMKTFYAAYVMVCERFTLYPVWSDSQVRLPLSSTDFEDYLLPGMKQIYRNMTTDGAFVTKLASHTDWLNMGDLLRFVERGNNRDRRIALANAIVTYLWSAPDTPPTTKINPAKLGELANKYADSHKAEIGTVVSKITEDSIERVVGPNRAPLGSVRADITPFVFRTTGVNIGKYIPSDPSLGYTPLAGNVGFASARLGDPVVNVLAKRKFDLFKAGTAVRYPVHPLLLVDTSEANPYAYPELSANEGYIPAVGGNPAIPPGPVSPPFSPNLLKRLHHYGSVEDPLTRIIGKTLSLSYNSLATFKACINANVAPPITAYLAIQYQIECRTQATVYAETGAGMFFQKNTDLGIKEQQDNIHAEVDVVNTMWAACDAADPERFHVVLNSKGSRYVKGFDTSPLICPTPDDLDLIQNAKSDHGSVMVIPLPSYMTRGDIPTCIPMYGKELALYRRHTTFNGNYERKYEDFLNWYDIFAHYYGLKIGDDPNHNAFDPNSHVDADFATNYSGLIWPIKHRETVGHQEHVYNAGPFKIYGPDLHDVIAGTIPFTMGNDN